MRHFAAFAFLSFPMIKSVFEPSRDLCLPGALLGQHHRLLLHDQHVLLQGQHGQRWRRVTLLPLLRALFLHHGQLRRCQLWREDGHVRALALMHRHWRQHHLQV